MARILAGFGGMMNVVVRRIAMARHKLSKEVTVLESGEQFRYCSLCGLLIEIPVADNNSECESEASNGKNHQARQI